jgi:outer membrane immunogenic protein
MENQGKFLMKYVAFAALMLSAAPAMAQEAPEEAPIEEIGGFRVEARLGIERPNLSEREGGTTFVAELSSSVAYGAEIGYDIPVSDNVTVGPYVSFDFANSDICDSASVGFNQNLEVCFEAKSNFSAGLRGAYATGGKGELYMTLGYDKYDYNYSETLRTVPANTVIGTFVNNKGDSGIGIGFGYNHMISKNIYAGLGMRVSEMGNFENSDWNLQRFQGHANIGFRF